MPTRDEHLKQARDNEYLADHLLQLGDSVATTWAATLIFYSALHYGRAFVVSRGVGKISNHVGFESIFRRMWTQTPDVFSHYSRLKNRSEAARYNCAVYTEIELLDLRDQYFRPFRDGVLAVVDPIAP